MSHRLVYIFFLLIQVFALWGQSKNMSLLANYKDLTIVPNGGLYYNDLWGYESAGREYVILGASTHTLFVDITDPMLPVLSDKEVGSNSCTWRDFKTYKNYAYGVSDCGGSTLQIFDLSFLPDSVKKIYDSNILVGDAHNIFIDTAKARLYAVGTSVAQMVVLDLSSNPASPSLLKNVNFSSGSIHDLFVNSDTVYCSHGTNGLVIYEMSDLNNIEILGSLTTYIGQGYNHSSWVSKNGLMVMADETFGSPVKLVDVSNPDMIDVLSSFKSNLLNQMPNNSIAHNPYLVGERFAVVSYYHDGVQLYNVEDPTQPFIGAYYDTYPANSNYAGYKGCWGVYPYLPSGNIVGSDIDNGLFILKPSFPLVDCKKTAEVNGDLDNNLSFNASISLKSGAQLAPNSSLNLTAGNHVELAVGFELGTGALLQIQIANPCNE